MSQNQDDEPECVRVLLGMRLWRQLIGAAEEIGEEWRGLRGRCRGRVKLEEKLTRHLQMQAGWRLQCMARGRGIDC
jgi:hypothetical protein